MVTPGVMCGVMPPPIMAGVIVGSGFIRGVMVTPGVMCGVMLPPIMPGVIVGSGFIRGVMVTPGVICGVMPPIMPGVGDMPGRIAGVGDITGADVRRPSTPKLFPAVSTISNALICSTAGAATPGS